MAHIIEEIFQSGVVCDELGTEYELESHIDRDEGEFLVDLINSDPDIHKTLEVGCAFGISSLFICSALAERQPAKHIIIDPYQQEDWHGVGIANLKRAGYDFFEFFESPSEFVLPDIARNEAGTFDLVFIDGLHTFDHTLLDLFYANQLVKVGGYIVADDCGWTSVAKALTYFLNYPAYQLEGQPPFPVPRRTVKRIIRTVIPPSIAGYLLPRNLYDRVYIKTLYSSMVALKKVADDARHWTWFESF